MNVKTLTAADISRTLALLSADLGRAACKRRNPAVSDDEALAWGMRHRHEFVCEAIDVLAMMALAGLEEEKRQARP